MVNVLSSFEEKTRFRPVRERTRGFLARERGVIGMTRKKKGGGGGELTVEILHLVRLCVVPHVRGLGFGDGHLPPTLCLGCDDVCLIPGEADLRKERAREDQRTQSSGKVRQNGTD